MNRAVAVFVGIALLAPACLLGLWTVGYAENGGTHVCESAVRIVVEGYHSHGGEITEAERAVSDAEINRKCQPGAWTAVGLGATVALVALGLIGFGLWPRRRLAVG